MSTPDLSKVIELIMQNPGIISEIQGLMKSEEAEAEPLPAAEKEPAPEPQKIEAPPSVSAGAAPEISAKARRAGLLSAMKPYVSSERAKAIDSMLSISEILEVMKVR